MNVKVYTAGVKRAHLALETERVLENGEREYHPHCGERATGLELLEVPLEGLEFECRHCGYQLGLLKQVKG